MSIVDGNLACVFEEGQVDEPAVGMPVRYLNGVETPKGAVVLASSGEISDAIEGMAQAILPWISLSQESPVVVVALLEGGRFFADRLVQELVELGCHPISRVDLKVSTRDDIGAVLPTPTIRGDVQALSGRRVLIVDDILDSGVTIRLVKEALESVVSELRVAVLLKKDDPVAHAVIDGRSKVDFVGLTLQDSRWFSGVGLDMPEDPAGLARKAPFLVAYPPLV